MNKKGILAFILLLGLSDHFYIENVNVHFTGGDQTILLNK